MSFFNIYPSSYRPAAGCADAVYKRKRCTSREDARMAENGLNSTIFRSID